MQRRERPAHDLDAFGAGHHDVRDLALAVGHGRRDAVGIQAQAAPKVERAPKPRIDSWVSWRFCCSRGQPGTPAQASASATPWPAASPSSAIVVTEAGTSNAGTSRSRAVVT